jgi:hypothetical protein
VPSIATVVLWLARLWFSIVDRVSLTDSDGVVVVAVDRQEQREIVEAINAMALGVYGLPFPVGVGSPAYPEAAIGVMRAELAPHAVRVLAFGNRLVDAAEGLRLGVVDEIVEPDAVLPRAIEVARQLATFPSSAYARTKHDPRGHTLQPLRAPAANDPLLVQSVG